MNRLFAVTAIAAVLIGLLVGFLWWGLPQNRLQDELRGLQTNANQTAQQLDDLRAQRDRLEAQLKSEASRREAAESDLRREKATSARLQLLVSQGKK